MLSVNLSRCRHCAGVNEKRSPRHQGHLHRLRNEEVPVPHRGVNFNGPGDCGQPADNGRLHTRSLPAASTRRGVAGSTSAEYESERKPPPDESHQVSALYNQAA